MANGDGQKRTRPLEFWFGVIGVVSAVVGAIAAALVFFVPSADARHPQADSSSARPAASTQPNVSSALGTPGPGPAEPGREGRYLASLIPTTGIGFLSISGHDLQVSCPTNQSDDTQHEVSYALPAPYSNLTTGLRVSGKADSEATAALQVFIQHRLDRTDREEQVGNNAVLRTGQSASIVFGPLSNAVQLTLRIRCTSRTQTFTLAAPQITR